MILSNDYISLVSGLSTSSRIVDTINIKPRIFMCAKWCANLLRKENSNDNDLPARLFYLQSDEVSEMNLDYHEIGNSSPVHELDNLSLPNN